MITRPLNRTSASAGRLAGLAGVWAALSAPVLYVILAILAVALCVVPQLPLRYPIDVGLEEGYGGDLPMLRGFNTAEHDEFGTYRWTDDGATISLPGLGLRPLQVELTFMPVVAAIAASGPQTMTVFAGGEPLATLPVRAEGGSFSLIVPARTVGGGELVLTLRSTTFSPPGDPRRLGLRLDYVAVTSLGGAGLALPAPMPAALWLLALVVAWATMRSALAGFASRLPIVLLAAGVALVAIAAWLDPPRWAFGATPALVAAILALLLTLLLRLLLLPLARALRLDPDPVALGRLTLIAVLGFALRVGGRFYPNAMHGDIGFHTNRFNEMAHGLIQIVSRNRGVDFPYPPGTYLLVAPFTLSGLPIPALLQVAAALADTLGALAVYVIALVLLSKPGPRSLLPTASTTIALLAAGLYLFTAAGFMTTWWSFDTHIYTQSAAVLLVAALALFGRAVLDSAPVAHLPSRISPILFVLLSIVFLGHFGFLINTTLWVGLLVGLTWIAAWCGFSWAQRVRQPLTVAYLGALIFAAIFFYSAYLPLFAAQAQTLAQGGLPAVAQRAPVSREVLWRTLWQVGLVTHFGFFPLPLALLVPVALIWPATGAGASHRRLLATLMLTSFLLGACFAALPFITLATNSPRWLMSSAWAVSIGAAIAATRIWRRGPAGRLVALVMAAFVIWNTALIWLGPMLWRIRPPEPF